MLAGRDREPDLSFPADPIGSQVEGGTTTLAYLRRSFPQGLIVFANLAGTLLTLGGLELMTA